MPQPTEQVPFLVLERKYSFDENGQHNEGFRAQSSWSKEEMEKYVEDNNIVCPKCVKHNFTEIREFKLMFKTFQGVTEDSSACLLYTSRCV